MSEPRNITVVGAGYVGLVTGACLAELGHRVCCVDCDEKKLFSLLQKQSPFHEPGLDDLVRRHTNKRLWFGRSIAENLAQTLEFYFLCVGTPSNDDGSADLSALWSAIKEMAPHLTEDAVVVIKSTVPVGTNAAVAAKLKDLTGRDVPVVSNPEFLREGSAIKDFMKPDRIVIGARSHMDYNAVADLYGAPLGTQYVFTSPESAELSKYASNAFLAARVSLVNEVALLCERAGADIEDVSRVVGLDKRVGSAFLKAGIGYGGSCFPKDVRALAHQAFEHGVTPHVLNAIHSRNEMQKEILPDRVYEHLPAWLRQITLAVWGLAFKPNTDDIREAPALAMLDRFIATRKNHIILGESALRIKVYDPCAMDNVRNDERYGERLQYRNSAADAACNADALVVCTEWPEFAQFDLNELKRLMRRPVIFDGRNCIDAAGARAAGFTYHGIGRP